MSNDQYTGWARVFREAEVRGMRDMERGVPRELNPFTEAQPRERARWFEGWDNVYELDQQDHAPDRAKLGRIVDAIQSTLK